VLLVSLVPPILVVALRKWFCDRVLRELRDGVTNQTGAKLAGHLLLHFKLADEIELKEKKSTRIIAGDPGVLALSGAAWRGKDILTLGEVALLVGRIAMEREHADLWGWRDWAVRFGVAVPAFTVMVVVFAAAVKAITVFVAVSITATAPSC